ncbi:hypothetical protein HDU76_001174, partial [Blyttiomyces sp. JEL0837]
LNTNPTAPINKSRFAMPLHPGNPLAARVHRLILAAIQADLKLLEQKGFRRATASLRMLYPSVLTLVGFLMLGTFLLLWGVGVANWEPGLPPFLGVSCAFVGVWFVVVAMVRGLLSDMKAEQAVLRLSNKRLNCRAPYTLDFTVIHDRVTMDVGDWICLPILGWFSCLAVCVPKFWPSTSGAVGGKDLESGAGKEEQITANLRMYPDDRNNSNTNNGGTLTRATGNGGETDDDGSEPVFLNGGEEGYTVISPPTVPLPTDRERREVGNLVDLKGSSAETLG